MRLYRYRLILVVCLACYSTPAKATSVQECVQPLVGTAQFRDNSIDVLRPDPVVGQMYWDRTYDLGESFEAISHTPLQLTPVSGTALTLTISPTQDNLLAWSTSDQISISPAEVDRVPISQRHEVIDIQAAYNANGLGSIAYLTLTSSQITELHLIQENAPGTNDWQLVDTVSDSACASGIYPVEAEIALSYDTDNSPVIVCGGEEGASVYIIQENRLHHAKRISNTPVQKIAVAKDEPVFFLLTTSPDSRNGSITWTSADTDWHMQNAGSTRSTANTRGQFFAPDRNTWLYKHAHDSLVEVGTQQEDEWITNRVATYLSTDPIIAVAHSPLRILSVGTRLTYYERTQNGWTTAQTVVPNMVGDVYYSDSEDCILDLPHGCNAGQNSRDTLITIGLFILLYCAARRIHKTSPPVRK